MNEKNDTPNILSMVIGYKDDPMSVHICDDFLYLERAGERVLISKGDAAILVHTLSCFEDTGRLRY